MTVVADALDEVGGEPARKEAILRESIPALVEMYKSQKEYLDHCRKVVDEKQQNLKETIASLTAQWEEENAAEVKAYENAKASFETTEMNLRAEAVEFYQTTGVKTFNENVGVQVRVSYDYPIDEAVKWAETNAPVMIIKTVDKKAFETLAADKDLGFVKKVEKVSAVLKGV